MVFDPNGQMPHFICIGNVVISYDAPITPIEQQRLDRLLHYNRPRPSRLAALLQYSEPATEIPPESYRPAPPIARACYLTALLAPVIGTLAGMVSDADDSAALGAGIGFGVSAAATGFGRIVDYLSQRRQA